MFNKCLQNTELTVHTVYSKVQALMKTFMALVALNISRSVNLRGIDEAITLLPGAEFQLTVLNMHYCLIESWLLLRR